MADEKQAPASGIAEGRVELDTKRGYDVKVADQILNAPKEQFAVREDIDVQINGVRFFVGGPTNGEALEIVMLPQPIAEVLRNQRAAERDAHQSWRRNTARSLGGTLLTSER